MTSTPGCSSRPVVRSRNARGTAGLEHLGAYPPLIAAIREELEHFVATDLRLHLAIAEHDRYVLTSIAIDSVGPDDTGELLRRFRREFTPEQVKHYLAKEIIARLPNASAIDLSQFAGLDTGPEHGPRSRARTPPTTISWPNCAATRRAVAHPFEVRLVGRWSDMERTGAAARGAKPPAASPVTPLAGREVAVEVEDADGMRRVVLSGVVPGRRYVVGKDDDCDIVVSACTRVVATASSGSTTTRGGSPTAGRPTASGSSRRRRRAWSTADVDQRARRRQGARGASRCAASCCPRRAQGGPGALSAAGSRARREQVRRRQRRRRRSRPSSRTGADPTDWR